MKPIKIAASVLNSDLSRLGEAAEKIAESGIEYLHFDVMDGEFVENITYGSAVQKAIKSRTTALIDTHLMVKHPERQIPLFAAAGSDIITFHLESYGDPFEIIEQIHSYGIKAGVAIKPDTPADIVTPCVPRADMILIMTVEPGYGGQGFIPETVEKIREIRHYADRLHYDIDIQVDGGINDKTAALVKEAGANFLVAGTYLFRAENMKTAADLLR